MLETVYNYVLDREGDVIFTLSGGNASLALWGFGPHGKVPRDEFAPADATTDLESLPPEEPEAEHPILNEQGLELAAPNDEPPDDELPDDEPTDDPLPGDELLENDRSATSEAKTNTGITFLVSSRHLILASRVFKRMLRGGWTEGKAQDDGFFHIAGEDWEVEALLILMNIIHGHNRKVPRIAHLNLLTQIALIIDYYELHEAAEAFGSIWIEQLRPSIPTAFTRDLIPWLCMSRILGEEEIFQAVMRVAVKHVHGEINTLKLPIMRQIEGGLPMQSQ